MSNVCQRRPRRRVLVALSLLTCALAACDARATAPAAPAPPAGLRPATAKPAAIEGDTLACTRGWVIITGVYVCNEDL